MDEIRLLGNRCFDSEQLLRLFRQSGRLAPHSPLVWSTWRAFKESGWLSGSQVLALRGVARQKPARQSCCCPYCDSELVDFPWTGRGRVHLRLPLREQVACARALPGFRFVARRLAGVLLLAPVLLLGVFATLLGWVLGMTFRPHQSLAGSAESPVTRLGRLLEFVFYEDFLPLHWAASACVLGSYAVAWVGAL